MAAPPPAQQATDSATGAANELTHLKAQSASVLRSRGCCAAEPEGLHEGQSHGGFGASWTCPALGHVLCNPAPSLSQGRRSAMVCIRLLTSERSHRRYPDVEERRMPMVPICSKANTDNGAICSSHRPMISEKWHTWDLEMLNHARCSSCRGCRSGRDLCATSSPCGR